MKRTIYLLIILLIALCLCCCTIDKNPNADEASFYYLRNDVAFSSTSPLLIEVKQTTSGIDHDYTTIIKQYLEGSTSDDYKNPFPADMRLISLNIESARASIILTQPNNSASPSHQTIAFACITKTVTELTGASNVHITLIDEQAKSEEVYKFTTESFSLLDPITIHDLEDS